MGQVYLGRDLSGRHAAIKVVHAAHVSDPQFRARFARGIAAAARVDAPWTAAVLDANPRAERPWLATEYVRGPSVEEAVAAAGPLSESAVLDLAGKLAEALAAPHATGVVHGDIKPSNVLLAADGPRLIDFGIARAIVATKITHTGHVIGTPAYMSPEQALGDEAGAASDVYSLAAVLTYAATGSPPFGHTANPVAMLLRVSTQQPDLAKLPARGRAVLEPCFAKEPAARPTSSELASRLALLVDEEPTPSIDESAQKTAPPTDDGRSNHQKPPTVPATAVDPTGERGSRVMSRTWMIALTGLIGAGVLIAAVLVAAPGSEPPDDRPPPTPSAAAPLASVAATPESEARQVASVPLGMKPRKITLSPDGRRAYAAGDDGMAVIDTASRAVVGTLKLPDTPKSILVSPDNRRVYLTQSITPSSARSSLVSVIDAASLRAIATIPVSGPSNAAAMTPDGRWIYVAGDTTLTAIDIASNAVVATIPVESLRPPYVAAESSQSIWAFPSYGRDTFVVVDTSRHAVTGTVPSRAVLDIAFTPDGNRAFAIDLRNGIQVIDPRQRQKVGSIEYPGYDTADKLVITPDGRRLYVNSTTSWIYDTKTNALVARLLSLPRYLEIAFAPEGRTIYAVRAANPSVDIIDVSE